LAERKVTAGEAPNPWAIRARWDLAEPAVRKERMLTALQDEVKGGLWFRLIDKVYALPDVRHACERVKAKRGAAGVDHVTVKEFERHLEANLESWPARCGPISISTRSTTKWPSPDLRWGGTPTTS
jgi:hypothetical protein